ncbi:MAG: hypothetical protein ACTSVZ_10950 [Promethearchaeota archaeon]
MLQSSPTNSIMKKHKILREEASIFLNMLISVLIIYLALLDQLNPWQLGAILIIHIGIIYITYYDEFSPPVILHFLRPLQGILIIAPFLSATTFFFTIIGGNFTAETFMRARMSVLIIYLMLIWTMFAAVSVIGIYFSIFVIVRWFPYLVRIAPSFGTPFILYIMSVLIAFIGVGCWMTLSHALYTTIGQKQDFGDRSKEFQKMGIIFLIITAITSFGLIFAEILLWNEIIPGFLQL